MKCFSCGCWLSHKGVEGSDHIKDVKGNWWCLNCTKEKLARWPDFERYEMLAEEPARYREALVDTLRWAIGEGYCAKPRERCEASADKCMRCWLRHLVGE